MPPKNRVVIGNANHAKSSLEQTGVLTADNIRTIREGLLRDSATGCVRYVGKYRAQNAGRVVMFKAPPSRKAISIRRILYFLDTGKDERRLFSQCGKNDCISVEHASPALLLARHKRSKFGDYAATRKSRFMASITEQDGHWFWKFCNAITEYGHFYWSPKKHRMGAHRASFILFKGPVPPGQFVCHDCHIPACVNPHHLYPGTPGDNMAHCSAARRGHIPRDGKHKRQGRINIPRLVRHVAILCSFCQARFDVHRSMLKRNSKTKYCSAMCYAHDCKKHAQLGKKRPSRQNHQVTASARRKVYVKWLYHDKPVPTRVVSTKRIAETPSSLYRHGHKKKRLMKEHSISGS